jgi:hypothetical protein
MKLLQSILRLQSTGEYRVTLPQIYFFVWIFSLALTHSHTHTASQCSVLTHLSLTHSLTHCYLSSKDTMSSQQSQTQTQRDWIVGASQPVPWGEDTQWKQFDPSDETAAFSRYSLLISCVVPRPIALCSTVSPDGSQNCAPFSYFGAISHDPLLISVTICNNGRGKSRTKKDTLVNIESSRDFVVNIMSEWYVGLEV